MRNKEEEIISAQVVIKGKNSAEITDPAKLTADNVALFMPAKEVFLEIQNEFRRMGFEIQAAFANSFSIAAPAGHFEKCFTTKIERDNEGNLRSLMKNGEKTVELPLDNLPASLRKNIVAVTFTEAPDFGPGNFGY